jgi:hypothetical protein
MEDNRFVVESSTVRRLKDGCYKASLNKKESKIHFNTSVVGCYNKPK